MKFKILKTSSANSDFRLLVAELDAHLAEMYGEEKDFFTQYNKVDAINYVIVIYDNNIPIGCGGIKEYTCSTMEVKRMYVKPEFRGQGIASDILLSLENWAVELGYSTTVLETLKVKDTVIKMYSKNGYNLIPNYGQYEGIESSICMSKDIN